MVKQNHAFLADNGGVVTVKKMEGLSSYKGSTQHGVTSQNRGPTLGAIMFQSWFIVLLLLMICKPVINDIVFEKLDIALCYAEYINLCLCQYIITISFSANFAAYGNLDC